MPSSSSMPAAQCKIPSCGAGQPSGEVAMRCCANSMRAPSSPGWGLALCATGQLLLEGVSATC